MYNKGNNRQTNYITKYVNKYKICIGIKKCSRCQKITSIYIYTTKNDGLSAVYEKPSVIL